MTQRRFQREFRAMRWIAALAMLCFAQSARAEGLEDLRWLEGCWRSENEHRAITEIWVAPPMPAMLGYAYTLTEGTQNGWEQTRIEMIDGAPVFIAMPMGGEPVRFPMTLSDVQRVVFENPQHDFPKRVEYWRAGDNLFAQVSDGESALDFAYRRIACESAHQP